MHPILTLVLLRAASVLVAPGPDEGCPSARQVSTALATRVPVAPRAGAKDASFTVILPAPGSAQEPSFSLVDGQGRLRLFRTLAFHGNSPRDCVALSETVALIVQRYLEEVELPEIEAVPPKAPPRAPTTPPPSPADSPSSAALVSLAPAPPPEPRLPGARAPWDVSLGVAARFANQRAGLEALEFGRLTVARRLGAKDDRGLLLALWVGISGWTEWSPPAHEDGARARLLRIPSGLALMWRHRLSTLELQGGLAGLVDCWVLGARYQDKLRWETRLSLAGALIGGLQVPISKSLFVRLGIELALAGTRYRYIDQIRGSDAAFTTPMAFAQAGFALGMSLR